MLLGTHGDVSYIGLNGIALFDATGAQIPIGAQNAAAQPESIAAALPKCKVRLVCDTHATDHGSCTRVFSHPSFCIKHDTHIFDSTPWVSSLSLPPLSTQDDVRVLGNLFDGVNDTFDARHMWLTPFAPFQPATLWLFFDRPITLSCVRVWNYSRTPSRGVHNLMVCSLRRYSASIASLVYSSAHSDFRHFR